MTNLDTLQLTEGQIWQADAMALQMQAASDWWKVPGYQKSPSSQTSTNRTDDGCRM